MFKNKNILIIKHGSTGDIFMSFNIIKSIKKSSSKITICSTRNGLKLFKLLNIQYNEIIDERGKIIDTLKVPLINVFPGLEILLFNLFEILKDIKLFIIALK